MKLIKILFLVVGVFVLAYLGFYMNSKIIKYIAGPSCNCNQKSEKIE